LTLYIGRILLEEGVDVLGDVRSQEGLGVPLDGIAVLVDEELLEVPRDVAATNWTPDDELRISHEADGIIGRSWQMGLEPSEQLVFTLTVNLNLVEHDGLGLEAVPRPDKLERVEDFLAVGVFLVAKLVGWEGQDNQLVSVLLAELVHLREVTDSRAS